MKFLSVRRAWSSRIMLCVLVALLPACAANKATAPASVQEPLVLQPLAGFRVTGGLGFWTETESISTRIDWRQVANDFSLMVTAPAGLTSVRLNRQGSVASVQRAGDDPVYGSSVSTLLQQALGLGVSVPVDQLSLWIQGLPGDASRTRYDSAGRLQSMQYRDTVGTLWRAEILQYASLDERPVPALISAVGGTYNVRLVLKNWSKLSDDALQIEKKPAESTKRLAIPSR